jgi:hypothetical protein
MYRSTIIFPSMWVLVTLCLLPAVLGSPLFQKRAKGPWLGLNTDFPDPSFMKAADNKWYAFGTNGNGKRIQVARSDDFNTWTLLDVEALPTLSTWETAIDHWAPDVILRVSYPCFQKEKETSPPRANVNFHRTTESMSCTTLEKLNQWSGITALELPYQTTLQVHTCQATRLSLVVLTRVDQSIQQGSWIRMARDT